MKVIIAGSRTVSDYSIINDAIKKSCFTITEVVSGTCKGVDKLGEFYAKQHNIPIKQFPADWSKGKSAGYLRNAEMANYADALIAIQHNNSKGTQHMINLATKKGLKVFILKVETNGI